MRALMGTAGTPSPGEVAAVLSALAGMRKGDPVAAIAAGRLTEACLAAGSGRPLLDGTAPDASARVLVVEQPSELVDAVRLLAPGGRLVTLAEDEPAARRAAAELGLSLRHVEALGDGVAWSAVRPLAP